MFNVKMRREGNKLLIEVDLEQEHGLSSTGKTISVASTQGNKAIEDTGIYLGLNVYKYPPKPARAPTRSSVVNSLNLD